jgi:hypothetical protein
MIFKNQLLLSRTSKVNNNYELNCNGSAVIIKILGSRNFRIYYSTFALVNFILITNLFISARYSIKRAGKSLKRTKIEEFVELKIDLLD